MTRAFVPWFLTLAAPPLRGGLWRVAAVLALWLGCASVQAQPAPLQLQAQQPAAGLWQALQMLPDPEQRYTAQDLLQGGPAFGPMPPTQGTLGVRAEPVWLRIPLELAASAPGRWVLDIDYAPLQRIDLVLASGGRIVQQAALGSHVPFAQRPLPTRSHAVGLELQPGVAYELLLRVQTQGAMVLPLRLSPPAMHAEHALREQMLQGLLTGLALCLWIYSLAQWINQREVLFLQYTLLISGSLLFSLHFFGVGAQYLWGGLPWFEQHASGMSALMATCGSFLFIGQALAAGNPRNRLMRAMRWGAAGTALLALAFALDLFDTRVLAAIVSVLGLVPALMGIPGAVARMRQGDAVGGTLLLAWLVYFVATATVIGVIRGWVPVNFWTLHSFQFGATLDMLLFMRVLGLRSKALRLAAENARTERDTLHWLAHTDPLTNLPNRRGMQEALSNALRLCCHEQQLAVYLLDLDGFKPVNDEHGHDVGDELLVAVARRLQGHVRATDLVARLGGDEFVVVASALESPAQAHDLANKLLDAFHAPFTLSSTKVQVGLTIGYALAPLDAYDAASLLKLADAAMYQGKQNGKFRVQRSTEQLAMP
ncbi:MAG TPA: diguanylate cyclase [Giesbergeria sp.]|nr:diguanylate cyclase [Giesbergeria sp.]HNI76151.1 diguanylate cyclase [Giesbergeria sp.]HNM40272.1 diguanylate cyclase [Giesbergeria sp.]HNN16291.1 diguanylate cyclase [Giesbergeria sp.]HNN88469.1 diguanylate cyclase [Giesbergeria sp.]